MVTLLQHAPPSVNDGARAKARRIVRALDQYPVALRPRVRAAAARHPWIADLALSFPALLIALTLPRRGVDADTLARLITSGAPLATLAHAGGVPLWLRALPPKAFAAVPIPVLPDSPDVRRRILNHLPKNVRDTPYWLESLSRAVRWGDDEIALWLAREAPHAKAKRKRRRRFTRLPDHRALLALWAWHSTHRHLDGAAAHIVTPWTECMSWAAATTAALEWRDALDLRMLRQPDVAFDPWLADGSADGFSFHALCTQGELVDEAAAMSHCVGTYLDRLADNSTRVFSVRKDGARVATLSLRASGPLPCIQELAGPTNAPVGHELWLAARQWMHAQDARVICDKRFAFSACEVDAKVWRSLWRPYWLAKRRIPPELPMTPNRWALDDLGYV